MKIQYNKNEIIAAARFIIENNPSATVPSQIPHTDRGFQIERGHVSAILNNIRTLAKENAKVYADVQKSIAAGDSNVDRIWTKWVEVMGVGGYWIISNIEDTNINFAVAVTPWFGEYVCTYEEI